ncbi:hypothetical protein CYMTET_47355 [Cymbomonas tetramitiformis]|uniref:Integrase catalytic domain-containing protein n=1 Tax=Cymbomonas tetramitiformis TaxID=36881 RepID=A0AAE0BU99_9CHLO|nr:hypothetical protein CYMTET_47355 [Cymbomonas tetramitiformis]
MVGTWTTVELEKAIEKGYKILDIYEIKHWKETTTDLFGAYIDKFLKLKTESSGPPDGDIDTFIKDFEFHEGIKLDKRNIKYNPVDKVSIQADLAFIPKDKSVNKGYAVILTAVNVNTNKAYAIALKSKTVRDKNNKRSEDVEGIVPAMRRLIKETKMDTLSTDLGSEFTNKPVQALLKEKGIKHYTSQKEDHTRQGKIKRFNKTLKRRFNINEASTGRNNWVDYLDSIVENYNETVNQGNINDTPPDDMNKNRVIRSVLLKRNQTAKLLQKLDIKPGDRVRLRVTKKTFDKESQTWSTQVYKVRSRKGLSFVIEDADGDTLSRQYKPRELKEVQGPVSKPSKETRGTKTDSENKQAAKSERALKKEGIEGNTASKTSRNYDNYEVNVFISDKKSPNYQKTLKGYLKLNRSRKSKRKYQLIFYDKSEEDEFVDIPDPEIKLLKKRKS